MVKFNYSLESLYLNQEDRMLMCVFVYVCTYKVIIVHRLSKDKTNPRTCRLLISWADVCLSRWWWSVILTIFKFTDLLIKFCIIRKEYGSTFSVDNLDILTKILVIMKTIWVFTYFSSLNNYIILCICFPLKKIFLYIILYKRFNIYV